MLEQLKDLKDTYESARLMIDRGKEPMDDLVKLRDFLATLAADVTLLTEKVDKDYRRYFSEEFSLGLLKRLTRERSRDDKYLDVIAGILEAYMNIFINLLKVGQLMPSFFDSIKFLFEYDSILHNYNYQIPEDQLKSLRSANQEWRKELKEGDMIDAIIEEANTRCSGWSQARISSVNGDMLHLEFIFDTKSADKYVDRWSVEVAQHESKTKELWEWKATVKVDMMIDAHDKTVWNKSTILDIKDQLVAPGRVVKMAYIGYRLYVENGTKKDEKGAFDGWSNRFDEWVAIYSPRIMPFYSKTQKGTSDDLDLDEDYDTLVQPEEGFEHVFAVPRLRKCISSLFIHLLNLFGNRGGFDTILGFLTNGDDQACDLNQLGNIVHCIAYPFMCYHRDFIRDYGPKFVELCTRRLREAPDQQLRDVRREKIEAIIKSIDNFQKRLVEKGDREKQTEILKLEVSLKCLRSSYLERRIQGIRDLNQIIKNNRMFSTKSFTPVFLIEWMDTNGVFTILFDTKKTHLQLVQRTNDILKLLLQENLFSSSLMEAFWSLAKSGDYKFEVYKIINENSFYLKQEHIDFFFEQLKLVPAEKLAIEEFQCLSELGKFAKEAQFKTQVTEFFWQIICNSEHYKDDLVSNCINKFCEMVKNWELKTKHDLFLGLLKNLKEGKSSIPTIRLFKGLLKDQKDRYSSSTYNSSPVKQQAEIDTSEITTLDQSLEALIKDEGLPQIVLANLRSYIDEASTKELPAELTRKKLYLVDPKYSHQDEIDERLQFLKYLAQISMNYQVSKADLNVLYELLVQKAVIESDQEEFLTWCKLSCEQSTTVCQILDLNEVGEFFTEKMSHGDLDVKNLLVVGFDFLQQYFLSVNETSQKLIKSVKQTKSKFTPYSYQSISYGYTGGIYGPKPPTYFSGKQTVQEDSAPTFKLQKPPSDLDQLDIVWNIALNCETPSVVPKAIDFLIKVYYSLDAELEHQRTDIQDELVEKCMTLLTEADDPNRAKRVIEIIKNIIYEAEKKGTGDVKPHNALLKGELLERIAIKNKASPKPNSLVMSIYSNTTVWEFKKEVAKFVDLAPKYLSLQKSNGVSLKDSDNGKTLAEIGLQSGENLTAYKIEVIEDIPNALLIGPDGHLTEKLRQIFNDWFTMYSDDTDGMTKETCVLFIKGCTGELPPVNDDRIATLFKTYDSNNDGRIERAEFLSFYEQAARSKGETVRENLKAHNIRPDLKKLSEVTEDSSFTAEQMPRLKISKNQQYFERLMGMLDRQGEVSEAAWNLIQMLATNQDVYTRVLQLKTAMNAEGKIEWEQFFDSQSVYKLLYTLQIVEAVMEEGEGEGLEKISIVEDAAVANKAKVPQAPLLPGAVASTPQSATTTQAEDSQPASDEPPLQKKATSIVDKDEDNKLKAEWTRMFLEHQGFDYILKVFMTKQLEDAHTLFELKHVAFLLKLLRIFIMASFSTSHESQIYQAVTLARRSSAAQDEQQNQNETTDEGSRFKELQKLLSGAIGENIIQQIDYKVLQQKLLTIVSQLLQKKSMIFEDKLIIENALSLWVGCILHKNELLNDFYTFTSSTSQNSDAFILQGLLFCTQEKIREEFKQNLNCLSTKLTQTDKLNQLPLNYLLKLLSDNFSLISEYQCRQYFELFCELIDQYFLHKSLTSQTEFAFNPESLLALIIDKIKEYNKIASKGSPVEETAGTQSAVEVSEQENIYIGLIQLTGKIIDNFDISFSEKIVEQKNLIDEIFVQFLFHSVFNQEGRSENEVMKLKPLRGQQKEQDSGKKKTFGKKSKDAAYKLLNSLIRKSPLLMNSFLEKSMQPLMSLIKRQECWNYSPPGLSENKQKFCGLRNLGCICYMNAMNQQFFMIPAFRYNILAIDDNLPEDLQDYKGHKVDDNVLHQLQKMFANLELTERNEYNPFEYCFSFKDFEGMPTNTSEQKDAQEYLNMKFDRIENLLRPTTRKHLVQSVFGGQTCSQLVCQECGKVKNRIEDFLNLSLTVKDIKSMQDSLQKLIEGEVINEYNCENCQKKVDVSKRTLISATPNVLIVHLQRIVFNFETFRNDKINSFFEFPAVLDLKPYSFYEVMKKENRMPKAANPDEEDTSQQPQPKDEKKDEDEVWPAEDDCFEYKLVGVTVHSGTANAGHYWSLINTRRGYAEPAEDDVNWARTDSDPWMEFNDSSVRDFNFEKIKEECFGGDGKGGIEDSFSFGGSYGKSAYMLVYERRKKKPIKVLATQDELDTKKDQLLYDIKREEYYKLVPYRECAEDITPNKIYQQVFSENQKFEFENDIYSAEFYDFVKGILLATQTLQNDEKNHGDILEAVKHKAISIGKKTVLELLARSFFNMPLKSLCDALIELFKLDPQLTKTFLEQSFAEDNCQYLIDLILENPDGSSRMPLAQFYKFMLNQLKTLEADYLCDFETVTVTNEKGETVTYEQHKALSARFIARCLGVLNTQAAKQWNRFENFLDVIYGFAVTTDDQLDPIGLEFYFKTRFIERACDFLLGRKSPLATLGEKRIEMGTSFSSPNFTPIIKLVTKMITNQELLQKYPLTEIEQKMLMHNDLLKTMLGSTHGSKEFGQCLANMCRENQKMSMKISKVFIKAINNSNYDNVKAYLTCLKPFLKLDDSLKLQKLEWVFGFGELIQRKAYKEERYKYGLELVDRIGDDATAYVSPVASGATEDSLFAQLLKCKGKLDTFAINCLKEMLSLMAKDDVIARFVYDAAPPTYQHSRYSDWIRPYLEYQKSEIERSNSYSYFKSKHDSILKSLKYLELYESRCKVFAEELEKTYEAFKQDPTFPEVSQDWLAYKNQEVIQHFPPQLIIGKQVADDKEYLVYDEDPLVKVTIYEVACEYQYSNPTGWFNLSLPHLEVKTSNYQTVSYHQHKRSEWEYERKKAKEAAMLEEGEIKDPQEANQDETTGIIEEEMPSSEVRNWFQTKKEGPMILKVAVTNKKTSMIKVRISLVAETDEGVNVLLPMTQLSDKVYCEETKVLVQLLKINPLKDFGKIRVIVETVDKSQAAKVTTSRDTGTDSYNIKVIDSASGTICTNCKTLNPDTEFSCNSCGVYLGTSGMAAIASGFITGDFSFNI